MTTLAVLMLFWCALTLWVESEGESRLRQFGTGTRSALLVYDADPIYNLDEQVCEAFGQALVEKGWRVTIATVPAAKILDDSVFQLYLLVANTYNWAPDRAMARFTESRNWKNEDVVALTIGAGSTSRSKRVFDELLKAQSIRLIDSKTLWLLRPNDETRMDERNIDVARGLARDWALHLSHQMQSTRPAD